MDKLTKPDGISIHALLAESDGNPARRPTGRRHFYPRSPCGERPYFVITRQPSIQFLSTLSLRRATPLTFALFRPLKYFYPRSPCGERLTSGQNDNDSNNISIHALLAESDASFFSGRSCFSDFYPRSPCGERRSHYSSSRPLKGFLSTLSLRRATKDTTARQQIADISIHALLAESDDTRDWTRGLCLYFYPRSPCGERLFGKIKYCCSTRDFYPRSPCGERLTGAMQYLRSFVFLSTLSLRRATAPSCPAVGERLFLSTLSLRRATSPAMQILTSRLEFLSTLSLRRATHPLAILSNSHTDFYPRSPCGERRVEWRNKPQVSAISIHALLAESDILSSQCHPNI